MRPVAACVIFAGAVLPFAALAIEPFQIRDIRVEGLQRTDAGTRVRGAAVSRRRHATPTRRRAAALRALFATGPLQGRAHRRRRRRRRRHRRRARRPSPSVDFVGTKEFDKDALVKALKDVGIGEGLPFDKALVDRAEQELKRQYLSAQPLRAPRSSPRSRRWSATASTSPSRSPKATSRTSARSASSATRRSPSRTLIEPVRPERRRLAHLVHQVRPLLAHQAQRRPRDAARLLPEPRLPRVRDRRRRRSRSRRTSRTSRSRSTSTKASPTRHRASSSKATTSAAKTSSRTLVHDQAGRSRTTATTSPPPRAPSPTCFGTFGYAFAHVEPRPEIDRTDRPGRGHARRRPAAAASTCAASTSSGNTSTRDEVIRREFRQFESAWYDGRKIKLSRDRVDRLGYFSERQRRHQRSAGHARPGRPDRQRRPRSRPAT